MAIAQRGSVGIGASSSSQTTANPTCPAGTLTGDFILLHVSTASSITLPTGFTQIYNFAGTSCTSLLCYRFATGADVGGSTTYPVTIGLSKVNTEIVSYTGVNVTTPIDAQSTQTNVTVATTAVQYPSVTTVDANALVIAVGTGRNSTVNLTNNNWSTPAGWIEIADNWSFQGAGGAVGNNGAQFATLVPGVQGTFTPPATTLVNASNQVLNVISLGAAAVGGARVFTGTTVTYELNRLAGTLNAQGAATVDAPGAANIWAGSTDMDLDGALSRKAGIVGATAIGAANSMAGTTNASLAFALSQIVA